MSFCESKQTTDYMDFRITDYTDLWISQIWITDYTDFPIDVEWAERNTDISHLAITIQEDKNM
jgi:hypothetical protein